MTYTNSSLKDLGDYLHAKGFLFGIYTAAGTTTCGGRAGSLYHGAAAICRNVALCRLTAS
jgi:hypothetical protein